MPIKITFFPSCQLTHEQVREISCYFVEYQRRYAGKGPLQFKTPHWLFGTTPAISNTGLKRRSAGRSVGDTPVGMPYHPSVHRARMDSVDADGRYQNGADNYVPKKRPSVWQSPEYSPSTPPTKNRRRQSSRKERMFEEYLPRMLGQPAPTSRSSLHLQGLPDGRAPIRCT